MQNATLQWLGQSFFKITTRKGGVICIDPWKDFPPGNNLFPPEVKIDDADVILVTHGHLDHLGDTVSLAKNSWKPNFKILSNFEIMIYLLEQGVPERKLLPMNKGGTITKDVVSYTYVDAVHSSGIGGFGPKHLVNGGEAGGFIIRLEDGLTIYHTGDTAVFSDMKLFSEIYHPDVLLLPIGDVFTMGPSSAAIATEMIKPKLVIPMHYGGSFQLPGKPEVFADCVREKTPGVKVLSPKPGEPVNLDEY